MSDFGVYHALGHQDAENDPNRQQQPVAPPNFQPQVMPPPGGYQQGGAQYAGNPQGYQQSPYDPQGVQQSYFPPQGTPQPTEGSLGGLPAQMGGMAISGDPSAAGAGRAGKKKNRHAYHNLEQAAPSPGTAGVPQGSQYFAGDPSQQLAPGGQYLNQPITPAMNQFPAQANAPFNPASPVTPMEHAARDGLSRSGSQSIAASGGPGSQQGRVDPDQIPSVPVSRDGPALYYLDHVYPTLEKHLPPPAVIPFVAHDQGNSSPKFARLSINSIPTTAESLASTGLPLGLLLQPLAPLQDGELPIPVLDFGETGPPRCRRCRAYINPFMTFRSGGNKFVCNMCTFPNDVPTEYFSPTNPQGVRVDREQRPELMRGTVEFMVPKEYWAKEPVGLRWLFLIDVTQESLNKGLLEAFCEGILNALYGSDTEETEDGVGTERSIPEGSKVGLITYDKEIYFYNLSAELEKAQMIVMPDIEDPFVPLSEGLFVDPYESKDIITGLLNQLPTMFSQIKNPEPALLPTLNSALAALSSTGGKIVCSLSALPTWGPGRLFRRDNGTAAPNNDAEKKLFTTEHPSWKKCGEKMVQSGVGVDFFVATAAGGYLDLATVGHVSATSGGEMFYYPNFHAPRDSLQLSKEIRHTVTRDTGYQALMKVRCSNGLQISSYHGNFVQHTFGADLEFGTIDADKAIGVMFSYDGKLDSKLDAHFQSALLYTTASGERRVRCHNIVASVSEGGREGMRFVDQDAIVNLIAKEAASRMTERSLKDIRGAISEKTVDILAGYRKNFSGSHPPGQLVLPENLKEFGMYMLALTKCRAFKGGSEPSDRRVHDMRMLKSMGALELSLYLYPRIIPIHNLSDEDGFPNPAGHLVLPPTLRASYSRIEPGGVYLIDNSQTLLLWLHASVSPNLLADLFGPTYTTLSSLDPFMSTLPVLETHLNCQVRNILRWLEGVRGSKGLTINVARQGVDGSEYEFARRLVEDRNSEAQSYVDWLVSVHRFIQLEITGQRKKDDSMDSSVANFTGIRPPYW